MPQEIPLPNGGLLARRSGRSLCVADNQNTYNLIDLDSATMFPVLPINQAESDVALRPFITVISENEFLILSWTGASTLGVFITGDGDPVRGTLDWPSYPESVCEWLYPQVFWPARCGGRYAGLTRPASRQMQLRAAIV